MLQLFPVPPLYRISLVNSALNNMGLLFNGNVTQIVIKTFYFNFYL